MIMFIFILLIVFIRAGEQRCRRRPCKQHCRYAGAEGLEEQTGHSNRISYSKPCCNHTLTLPLPYPNHIQIIPEPLPDHIFEQVIALKRKMGSAGYAGVDNPVYSRNRHKSDYWFCLLQYFIPSIIGSLLAIKPVITILELLIYI